MVSRIKNKLSKSYVACKNVESHSVIKKTRDLSKYFFLSKINQSYDQIMPIMYRDYCLVRLS